MAIHPRLRSRGTPRFAMSSHEGPRALAYTPGHEHWVTAELSGTDLAVTVVASVGDIIAVLSEEHANRPQFLIIDFDKMTVGEVLELHSVREHGWFGNIIAIGRVSAGLRKSLGIDRTVMVGPDKLRPVAKLIGQHTSNTIRLPKLRI